MPVVNFVKCFSEAVLINKIKRSICSWIDSTEQPRWQGRLGVWLYGHRELVGGLWDDLGMLQFSFLISQGLKKEHVLLDIGCGSLRGGRHFIPPLDKGHYLGLEMQKVLLRQGIKKELEAEVLKRKSPEFVVDSKFQFSKFSKVPDYSLAQSLFTHLTKPSIESCLKNLRKFVFKGHLFYATFFECDKKRKNNYKDHPSRGFQYTRKEMRELAERHSWQMTYLGDWQHPKKQRMLKFEAV